MPMEPIDTEVFPLGKLVYEVTTRSGWDGLKMRQGTVTKLTKTRATVTFGDGQTEQYYNRHGWDVMAQVGEGQRVWSTTSIGLYPDGHEKLADLKDKARAYRLKEDIYTANAGLQRGVNVETVEAMLTALNAWKAVNVFGDES